MKVNTQTIKKIIRQAGGKEVKKRHGNLGQKRLEIIDQKAGGFTVKKDAVLGLFQLRFYGEGNTEEQIIRALEQAGYEVKETDWGYEVY